MNNEGRIEFNLNQDQYVEVSLLSLEGKKIRMLYNDRSGTDKVFLDIQKENLTPGIYFIQVQTENGQMTERLIVF